VICASLCVLHPFQQYLAVDLQRPRGIIRLVVIGRTGIEGSSGGTMDKKLRGLTYAAALAAMLNACVVIHTIHPWFHPATTNGACDCSASGASGIPACRCSSGPSIIAGHAAGQILGECPVCQLLTSLQARDVIPAVTCVSLEAASERQAYQLQSVYVPPVYAPANARAPPSCFLSAGVA